MCRRHALIALRCLVLAHLVTSSLHASEEARGSAAADEDDAVAMTLRIGQGGFTDDRSPIGALGGGQLSLDVQPRGRALAVSVGAEYYTNSAEPTHSYEISGLYVVNVLYVRPLGGRERGYAFIGGGIGALEVPRGEDAPDESVWSIAYDLEAGLGVRVHGPIGVYGVAKYLYAHKTVDDETPVDFSEAILLLGLTVHWSF